MHLTITAPITAAVLATLGAAGLSAAGGTTPPRYRAFIYPPASGVASAFPSAFSATGEIVGSAAPEPFHPDAIAVTTAGASLVELPSPIRFFNAALGAGGDGLVVGIMGLAPAYWLDGSGDFLTPLPGYFQGNAWDANNAGLIVGNHTNDLIGFDLPVYWPSIAAGAVELPVIDSPAGAAFAVNDAGQIAGGLSVGFSLQAVRWDTVASTPVVVGPLNGAVGGEARAINAQGDIAGRSVFPDFSVHAMLHLRSEDELIDLGTLSGSFSEARAVNAKREVVGVSSADRGGAGFLWRAGTMFDLNDLVVASNERFFHVSSAVDIDDAGRIAAEVAVLESATGQSRMALLTPCAATDLNCDGSVDGADLGLLLADWGGRGIADLDGSGAVDGADVGLLLGGWG